MTHYEWLSKSTVARLEGISRRTVQRTCLIWQSHYSEASAPDDAAMVDEKGRVRWERFRKFRSLMKQVEKRGFPSGGKRTRTGPWRDLMKQLRNRKAFGRTYDDRRNTLKAEIEAMTDSEQKVFIAEILAYFRPAAHEYLRKQAEILPRLQRGV